MIDPLSPTDRDAIGTADRLVVATGAALASLLPTLVLSIFWPEALRRSVVDPSPRGRTGPVLGAGLFFVLAIVTLSLLAFAINPEAGGLAIAIGEG